VQKSSLKTDKGIYTFNGVTSSELRQLNWALAFITCVFIGFELDEQKKNWKDVQNIYSDWDYNTIISVYPVGHFIVKFPPVPTVSGTRNELSSFITRKNVFVTSKIMFFVESLRNRFSGWVHDFISRTQSKTNMQFLHALKWSSEYNMMLMCRYNIYNMMLTCRYNINNMMLTCRNNIYNMMLMCRFNIIYNMMLTCRYNLYIIWC